MNVPHFLLAASMGFVALMVSCKLPTSSSSNDSSQTGNPSVDQVVVARWDQMIPDLVTPVQNNVYWLVSASGIRNGSDLTPAGQEGVVIPVASSYSFFANNGNLGEYTRTGTSNVYTYSYDYTIKDTLGSTYLLICSGSPTSSTSAYTPSTFSDLMANLDYSVICFRKH